MQSWMRIQVNGTSQCQARCVVVGRGSSNLIALITSPMTRPVRRTRNICHVLSLPRPSIISLVRAAVNHRHRCRTAPAISNQDVTGFGCSLPNSYRPFNHAALRLLSGTRRRLALSTRATQEVETLLSYTVTHFSPLVQVAVYSPRHPPSPLLCQCVNSRFYFLKREQSGATLAPVH